VAISQATDQSLPTAQYANHAKKRCFATEGTEQGQPPMNADGRKYLFVRHGCTRDSHGFDSVIPAQAGIRHGARATQ